MNALRISVLIFVFGCVGIVLAGIRVEQTRCMARIQNTRLKQLSLRRTMQGQQLQIARLRSPDQITSRIDRLRLQVFAPEEIDQLKNSENLNFALAND